MHITKHINTITLVWCPSHIFVSISPVNLPEGTRLVFIEKSFHNHAAHRVQSEERICAFGSKPITPTLKNLIRLYKCKPFGGFFYTTQIFPLHLQKKITIDVEDSLSTCQRLDTTCRVKNVSHLRISGSMLEKIFRIKIHLHVLHLMYKANSE